MGTNSTIAILNPNGTVTGIYCHYDGYLEYNGKILTNYYKDEATVRALIAGGSLRALKSQLKENEKLRDKEEAVVANSYHEYLVQNAQEYNYIFDPNQKAWLYCESVNGETKSVAIELFKVALREF